MLVLVAGATGNIGKHLIDSVADRGHQVRALGRNPSKLPQEKLKRLESFVSSKAYYDVDALDYACTGVDAVVIAYGPLPELQFEGQLMLIRAAERAGVTRVIAASWTYDWSNMPLGLHESLDPYISLRNQVELSSTIKPIYIYSGVLAETLFSLPGHGDFSPKNHGVWDPKLKKMEIWGHDGNQVWQWSTEKDAAEFAAALIQRDDAPEGGSVRICSGQHTLREIAEMYERVKGVKIDIQCKGTVEELRKTAFEARQKGSRKTFWEYIGWFYQLFTVDDSWTLKDLQNDRIGVKTTSLEEFLRNNPHV